MGTLVLSSRSRARGLFHPARIIAVLLALASTSCLLISGRPVLYFGEPCAGSGDCPSFGFCAATDSGNVCLPNSSECTTQSDPVCGGYACDMSYAIYYCERYCRASVDCATGYNCDFSQGDGSEGVCKSL